MKNFIKVFVLLCSFCFISGCSDDSVENVELTNEITVSQINEEQKLKISIDQLIDAKTIEVVVKHNDYVIVDKTYKISDYEKIGYINVDSIYGFNEVDITTFNAQSETDVEYNKTIGVSASEYNIAPLVASMTTTLFSVGIHDISETIPTFVMLERAGAYNWENLPENVYQIPGFETNDLSMHQSITELNNIASAWIKELYEVNNKSFFNLYYNDCWLSGALKAIYENEIPNENFHLTLLSDGSGSSVIFNDSFNVADPYTVYDELLEEYNALISKITTDGEFTDITHLYHKYFYVMITENDNMDFWASRISNTYISENVDFQADINDNESMVHKDLNTILNSLSNTEASELKSLFDFSESFFEEAIVNNKKVMIILGTYDHNEFYFEEYISFLKKHYGDEYVYYYKGHPVTPTQLIYGKQEKLDSMNLIDVDSTIPAELIIFFNPEIYASGYSSSTFLALEDDKVLTVFGEYITGNDSYIEKIDMRIYFVDSSHDKYAEFSDIITNNEDFFVVEIYTSDDVEYIIYDSKKDAITTVE